MTGRPEFSHWCSQVCGRIRFKPDRKAVYQELMDHLRDSAQALEETGMESRQAVLLAVERMGDPETVGEQLDRSHSPWLGWLWVCSCWALKIALVLALFSLFPLEEAWGQFYAPWPESYYYADRAERLMELRPDCRAEYGGYRFSIPQGAVNCFTSREQSGPEQGEAWQSYQLELVLRSWNPRFYLGEPTISPYLHLEDNLGNRYVSFYSPEFRTNQPSLQFGQSRRTFWVQEQKLTVWFDYGQGQTILKDIQWIELVYQREGQGFRLRIPLDGEAIG